MDRRKFLGSFVGIIGVPFVPIPKSKSNEVPYNEPFEGYNKFLTRLERSVGREVDVQDTSTLYSAGPSEILIGIKRITSKNERLFPHEVLFYNGSTINLRNIGSIAIPGAPTFTRKDMLVMYPNPESKDTLYVNLPSQEAQDKMLKDILNI